MKQPERPHPGSRMVDRIAIDGTLQPWPSNTVRYISRSWRGPVHILAEGIDFNLRYVAMHDHIESGRYPRHFHPHAEFILVVEGHGNIDTDRKEFRNHSAQPGTVFVMPPRMVHQSAWRCKSGDSWRLLVVDFDMAMDVALLPLEEGEHVDLGFTPFHEWFFNRQGFVLSLDAKAWARIEPVAREIMTALENPQYGMSVDLLANVLRLIAGFSRALREQKIADGRHPSPPMFSRQSALLKARTLMEHRGWFDPGCVGRLAREVGMSETHFIREFHVAYGLSPKQYSQRVLMRRACALLTGTDLPVKAIAERLGYEDASIFSRAFTRAIGRSPALYRRNPDAENGKP